MARVFRAEDVPKLRHATVFVAENWARATKEGGRMEDGFDEKFDRRWLLKVEGSDFVSLCN
jgi:hypothetical protein